MFKTLFVKELKSESDWFKWMVLGTAAIGVVLRLKSNEWPSFAFFILVFGALNFAILYRAVDMFVKEWRHKTSHLLFSLPIPRWQIVLAKFTVVVVMAVVAFGVWAAFEAWLIYAEKDIDLKLNAGYLYFLVLSLMQLILLSSILMASKLTSYTAYRFRKLTFVVLFLILTYAIHNWLHPFTTDLLNSIGLPKVKILVERGFETKSSRNFVELNFWASLGSLIIWTIVVLGLSSISVKKVEVE